MMKIFVSRLLFLCLFVALALVPTGAQQSAASNLAPGAPGKDAQWTNAGKTGVGTSNTLESKVWFTLRDGAMTEVYYPTVDVANTRMLELMVVDANGGSNRVELESTDTTHRTEVLDPQALTFRQVNTAKHGGYRITKTYITDPQRHTVLINVRFENLNKHLYALYVYYDPSIGNSGMHDSAWRQGDVLLASDADKASALMTSPVFLTATNGYFETSDGLAELRRHGQLADRYVRASDGNVVQVALVKHDAPFTLALGFGKEPDEAVTNARASLVKGFERTRAEYEAGWHEYTATLRRVAPRYQQQFQMAAMVLKAHEDKTYRGAMIASLSIPWGGGSNANEPNVGGYHLVWSRDLYQVATAFYALGDKASADRALNYLFKVQQKPDGSFPQNSWLDGRPFWGSLQMDEVAYPLILAYQLGRTDNETWTKHVRPAADFLIRQGPRTHQERWEEKPGYSASTIAAEIAGLVCAAEIARRNDDEASAHVYRAAADDWARNVERWTATNTGPHADGNYYMRITDDDDPNDGDPMNAGNGGGTFDEREYVDAGFLELVRLGIKRADDPLIAKSLAVVDSVIRVETPNGATFYRYNHDGYGEMDDGRPWNWDGKYTGKGRLWALLAGERGQYELARGQGAQAARRLDALAGFANDGLMIPEQVWDMAESPRPDLRLGEGTGSATPLAWSMAQFIRLAVNLQEGRNIETPDIVAARYTRESPPAQAMSDFNAPAEDVLLAQEAGNSLHLGGGVQKGARAFAIYGTERRELKTDERGRYELDVPVARGDSWVVVGTLSPNGATSFHRVMVRGLTPEEKARAEASAAAALAPAILERLRTTKSAPIIEGEDVTFVYRGDARRVEVVGDFTEWQPRSLLMRSVEGAGVKYYTRRFPKGARVEYQFIADGKWMLDPLNPNSNDNGVGSRNSFFTMPGYRTSQVAQGADEATRRGTVETVEVPSRALGGARKVHVYLPPSARGGSTAAATLPVLYLQDGSDYLKRGRAIEIAERLVAEKKARPFIIVFVDPQDRMKEYWANDQFAAFMATELVPYIDARYPTRRDRDSRALLGASLGGVISVWTALKHPETFARVGGQSTAFQIDDERVVAALAALNEEARRQYPLKFYFDVGRLEPLYPVNRRVRVMLTAKGYPVIYDETDSGHNYTTWRDQLADAFTALWAD